MHLSQVIQMLALAALVTFCAAAPLDFTGGMGASSPFMNSVEEGLRAG